MIALAHILLPVIAALCGGVAIAGCWVTLNWYCANSDVEGALAMGIVTVAVAAFGCALCVARLT